MNLNINRFFRDSGLKVLAISNLNACEYAILFYLLNCAISGLENLISNESELGSIIGHSTNDIRLALERMASRSIIKLHYGDGTQSPSLQSVSLGINWDISKWKLMTHDEETAPRNHHEAIIFPFRKGSPNLQLIDGTRYENNPKPSIQKPAAEVEAWQRIFDSFIRGRDIDEHESESNKQVARTLSLAHPIDQILVLVRHFNQRIPTLSLLASNWAHYAELYEQESQKLDLFEVRQRQTELDQKARDAAMNILSKSKDLDLSEEEIQILELLSNHRHPRRQLFWAYQQRIRYPKLAKFFTEVHNLMLPITQTGQVVKMPTE